MDEQMQRAGAELSLMGSLRWEESMMGERRVEGDHLERKTWSGHVGHGMAQNENFILSVVGCSLQKSNFKFGRTDAKAEAPILWPPDAKSQLIGKDPDAGKDFKGSRRKG